MVTLVIAILLGNPIAQEAPPLPEPWAQLAMCESSLRPDAVNPSGKYRGLFQFDHRSWQYVGGTGDPAAATQAEQLLRARKLQEIQGWKAWPVCAKKVGLL